MTAKKLNINTTEAESIAHGRLAAESALYPERKQTRPRKQIGIRIPADVFDDLEVYGISQKFKGNPWTLNEEVASYLINFTKEHRAEIDQCRARNTDHEQNREEQ